jgi:hypothetical protein
MHGRAINTAMVDRQTTHRELDELFRMLSDAEMAELTAIVDFDSRYKDNTGRTDVN